MKHATTPQDHSPAVPKEKVLLPRHDEWTPYTDKRPFDERIWDS